MDETLAHLCLYIRGVELQDGMRSQYWTLILPTQDRRPFRECGSTCIRAITWSCSNCEHFVTEVRTGELSIQVWRGVELGVGAASIGVGMTGGIYALSRKGSDSDSDSDE